MPGRHKSPVQQAWEYANDTQDCQWVLLSNMLEIRLYAISQTRQVYERWDILDLADSDTEYQRFRLILGADNLLGGRTANCSRTARAPTRRLPRSSIATTGNGGKPDYRAGATQPRPPFASHHRTRPDHLDRVLFIAFAEDRDLLPAHTLAQAFAQQDPFNPQPVWENFKGLFRFIDKGNSALHIPAYNGGLFRADPSRRPDPAGRRLPAVQGARRIRFRLRGRR